MEFISLEIAKPQMHHPRRRIARDDAVGKIRVLADDDQFVMAGILPKLGVAGVGFNC